MKKHMIVYSLLVLLLAANSANAQRFFKGQQGIEIRGGLANGYFFGKDQNQAYYLGAAFNHYTSISSRWVLGGEFYHKRYAYEDRSLNLAQFAGEIGHYFPLISDPGRNFIISAGASGIAGYERLNWGVHGLYDGGILLNQDKFIGGAAVSLEAEFFLSDKLILFVNGRERLLFNAHDRFNSQIGIGAKIMIR